MSHLFHLFRTALMLPAAAIFAAVAPFPGWAGSHDAAAYAPENVAQIDILPGWRQADGSHMAALRIRLADGWKTYWRTPGDGGIPPGFDWAGSRNLGAVSFHWPVPEVFDVGGLRSIGYRDELILPIQMQPKQAGQEISLKGRVSIGICHDVCMPLEAQFSATLPATGQGADSEMISQSLRQRPQSATEAGLSGISCDVTPIADGLRVTAQMAMPRVGQGEFVVLETADQGIWVSQAEVQRSGGTLTASADLVPPSGAPFILSRADIRITVLAGSSAVDIQGCTLAP